jgi:DNA-binding GntR family transcriptional regulator
METAGGNMYNRGNALETAAGIIETRSLSEQVYQVLCTRIIEGGISYGENLNIKQIASKLSVSPMPVREAIKRLEHEGIVRIKPRSTCLVKEPTKISILNAIELREVLESYCVEKSYASATAQSLQRIAAIVDRMKPVVAAAKPTEQSLRKYITLDRQFHTEICRLAGNEFINKSYREVNLHLNMQFIYDIAVPPDIERTYEDHMKLFEALSRRSERAVSLMKEHLRQSRKNVLEGRLFNSLQ